MTMAGVLAPIQLGASPSLASFIGTMGSDTLLSQINSELNNSSFFNSIDDILSRGRQMFIENHIRPIQQIGTSIKNLVGMFDHDDVYKPIETEEDLRNIPACMHDSIMRYEPVKKLFDQSRIFGFGWDYVPEEDCYGRLLANGCINDVLEAIDDEGYVEFEYNFESTDPELSFEELASIEATRKYIDKILAETDYDPTDFDNLRG